MTTIAPLTLQREFKAPRNTVWAAYTQAQHLAKWWGPKGMPIEVVSLDVRPGGLFHYAMKVQDNLWYGRFLYEEVQAPERLVFVTSFSDVNAGVTRHPLAATWPLRVRNTLRFVDQGATTLLDMVGVPVDATDEEMATFDAQRKQVSHGFKLTLDQFEEYLATL